jgi:hypothetical protein
LSESAEKLPVPSKDQKDIFLRAGRNSAFVRDGNKLKEQLKNDYSPRYDEKIPRKLSTLDFFLSI